MNDTLYRLVYLSRNAITGDETSLQREITQILRTARRKNGEGNITGALMFNARIFAQVLEGPRDQVEELFQQIEKDPRHSEVVVLDMSPIECRGFPEWAMAFVGEESSLVDRFFMIAEETNFNPERLSGDQVFDVLLASVEESNRLSTIANAA